MPERYVLVRWPLGPEQRIYSPSTVVEDYFTAGQRLPVADFVAKSREALTIASDRVQALYGYPCSNAARSLAAIEAHAARYADGDVTVEGIES
ncbi:hypothetical protein GCM10010435_87590 [Winogradskya consettensis]|uniref:MSMEG_0570 family nitrogen starvation response protein n=1 Tax=Winogradskya consettensis TaxID=113560 RepID=A0A919VXQ2_9ACTN|nr:MSMEG_0570 family nitrogen starvation response protein [Actinoplanes consettensis]GIM80951.1 hypothetical protein Aco04nite_73870 [Actinoplanes consettensis]